MRRVGDAIFDAQCRHDERPAGDFRDAPLAASRPPHAALSDKRRATADATGAASHMRLMRALVAY